MCQGYYRHKQGYMPKWPGMADFKGQIVHSEEWPDDLEIKDKNGPRDRFGRNGRDDHSGHRGGRPRT